ncbi:ADP-ribosyltransferase [Bacillus atrophaeus]
MKILEAHSLLESAETRLKAFENMREEMAALKKQFKGMANLDDAMTGKGANAIKAFYNEQAEGAGLWLDLIDMKIAFFKSVPREIESAKFDDNAYVEESYLDSELNNAIQKADGIIDAHHNGLNKARVPHTMQVYRGTDLRPLESLIEFDKYGDVNAESLIGKTFRDNGFVSTAIVKESSFDHMKVSWEINVPAGANAAYIGKISHFPNEAELLLNFGQEMVIKSARVDSSNKLHIVLDLI